MGSGSSHIATALGSDAETVTKEQATRNQPPDVGTKRKSKNMTETAKALPGLRMRALRMR